MKRFRPPQALCAALLLVAGCTNTLGFGTATKFALDVSQQPDQTVDVSLGYDRTEMAAIPAEKGEDAAASEDTYSVLGLFDVSYGNPWTDEPLKLHQFFATGWAARKASSDPSLQRLFGARAAEICGAPCDQTAPAGEVTP